MKAEQPDLTGDVADAVGEFPAVEFPIAAYAKHQGAHWAVEPLLCGGDMDTYDNRDTAVALTVHMFQPDGTMIDFPVELPIWFDWSANLEFVRLDLCNWIVHTHRGRWHAGAGGTSVEAESAVSPGPIDCALASDGDNLWLGVVCQREEPYPWYFSRNAIPYFPDPADLEALSAADGLITYIGSFPWCFGSGSPWDDLGTDCSQRWRPWRLIMYWFDGGEFVEIGQIDPSFAQGPGANEIGTVDPDQASGSVTGVEMCASPAEPGVCHAVWGEYGLWGQRSPGPGVWPNRGSRMVYSRWSSGGKLLENDILEEPPVYDRLPYPPPDRPSGIFWQDPSRFVVAEDQIEEMYAPRTEDSFSWTPVVAVRNDHGSPVMFMARMKLRPLGDADPIPGMLDEASSELGMYDLSSGDAVLLQTLDQTLLPQPADTVFFTSVGGGFTVGRIPQEGGNNGPSIWTRTNLAVSSLYEDPLLSGTPVYLLNVGFVPEGFGFTASGEAQGFYRVPCDGSDAFDFLDGNRNLAILPNANHPVDRGFFAPFFDFLSEPASVWIPSDGFTPAPPKQLDRVCFKDWLSIELGPGNPFGTAPRSGVAYDPVERRFFYGEYYTAVGQTQIIDKPCIAGLHVWQRIGAP